MCDTSIGAKKQDDLITELTNAGYFAVCLSSYRETCIRRHIFDVNGYLHDKCKMDQVLALFFNFIMPDIIFLHLNELSILSLDSQVIDIFISEPNTNNGYKHSKWHNAVFLDINKDTSKLLNDIYRILG
jgi:hypothetical protein